MADACHMLWASVLAFVCILALLGVLLSMPFCLVRLRGTHPLVDAFMERLAACLGASAPSPPANAHRKPASRQLLRSLKVTRYQARSAGDAEAPAADDDCCAICVDNYEPGDAIVRLWCGHYYHKACILPWLKLDATCPMCKATLPQPMRARGAGCKCAARQGAAAPAGGDQAAAGAPAAAEPAAGVPVPTPPGGAPPQPEPLPAAPAATAAPAAGAPAAAGVSAPPPPPQQQQQQRALRLLHQPPVRLHAAGDLATSTPF